MKELTWRSSGKPMLRGKVGISTFPSFQEVKYRQRTISPGCKISVEVFGAIFVGEKIPTKPLRLWQSRRPWFRNHETYIWNMMCVDLEYDLLNDSCIQPDSNGLEHGFTI